jgi:hypothetical protein
LFLFFCDESQLIGNFTLQILAAQCLFRSDAQFCGGSLLAERLLLFQAQRAANPTGFPLTRE